MKNPTHEVTMTIAEWYNLEIRPSKVFHAESGKRIVGCAKRESGKDDVYYEMFFESGPNQFASGEASITCQVTDGVILVASGYEWTCPNCRRYSRQSETTTTVHCERCGMTYPVMDIFHVPS